MSELSTPRLLLRRFSPRDGDDLFDYLGLPETYTFEPGKPLTREQSRQVAAERAALDMFWAVVLQETGKVIGHLYFEEKNPRGDRIWTLGYIFNPAFQRRGYCTEASRGLIGHAFENLGASKITASCNSRNTASWKTLESLGFTRDEIRLNDDGTHGSYTYGLLAEDFSRGRGE
ncbi:GNAT family N-acetyltransferase [Spirochaeta lutea]|uniref:GNAT family N-acetyltransferase n=1 Tax=Spirochaeta lutea TaxID=1480694 RepID=UPI0006903931|nr:GNAT family N-acetyltransferase [Spirochaeta lutea]